MDRIFPRKLRSGDTIRIIAPSRSLSIISEQTRQISDKRFEELGLKLTFGRHVNECDEFSSSSIQSRLEDLHEAFADSNVAGILTSIGGFNSNQLLRYVDYDLIARNPKVFCGYSDITAIGTAIHARTGLVTYYGPHYSSFGQKLHFDYSLEYFRKCLFGQYPFEVVASPFWSDDAWYLDQEARCPISYYGYRIINEGEASGASVGGNLCTLNLLHGTEYMPSLDGVVLFIEDDATTNPVTFDRDLQSLIHQPGFEKVRGLVVGRFQKKSEMTDTLLDMIIKSKRELASIPVIADANFGHADPKFTFPIGGEVEMVANSGKARLGIRKH